MEPKTVEDVLALLQEWPRDAKLFQLLGQMYFKRRDLREAWQAYWQSLQLAPDDPWTYLFFGNLLSITDDTKTAMDCFKHAAKLMPHQAVVYWCQGDLYRKLQNFDRAEQVYEKAVEVAPNDEQAQRKLAEWRDFIAGTAGPREE